MVPLTPTYPDGRPVLFDAIGVPVPWPPAPDDQAPPPQIDGEGNAVPVDAPLDPPPAT